MTRKEKQELAELKEDVRIAQKQLGAGRPSLVEARLASIRKKINDMLKASNKTK